MKILLITQWFWPIKGGGAKRTTKIAQALTKAGHKVMVLTGFPSYPTGILEPKYQGYLWMREKMGEIEILRTYEYPSDNKKLSKRILNDLSFTFSATIAAFILPPHDAVIVSSPSFSSGLAGLMASIFTKTRFYFDVRDLWPDSLIDLGILKKGLLANLLKILERIFYSKAKIIISTTPSITKHLISEKIPKEKIATVLNSADTNLFKPQTVDRKPYGYKKSDFIVTYIGNHSRVYDLKTVLKSAKKLNIYPRIKFLFVGDGESKDDLIKLSQKLNLKNIVFLPSRDQFAIAKIVSLSDLSLIPIGKNKISQEAIPTKTSEYFACGKPVIAAIGGDLKKYITQAQTGLIYPSGDVKELTKAILIFFKNPKLKQKMGQNARKLALLTFSDTQFKNKFLKIISGDLV